MSKVVDLTGIRFGHLIVKERYDSKNGNARWLCVCDCGNEVYVYGYNLKSGHTKSCGCFKKKATSNAVKKYNIYDLSNEFGIGYTTNSNKEFYFDLEDYEIILPYTWLENDKGYIVARNLHSDSPQFIRMHRLVIGAEEDTIIDHINLKKYDNRKSNLRYANKQLNGINRPHNYNNQLGIKGVERYGDDKYLARITVNGSCIYLGIFNNIEDAKAARLNKEIELFGEFAYLGEKDNDLHTLPCA